jgi:anthranilate phosphoribosyltransferase
LTSRSCRRPLAGALLAALRAKGVVPTSCAASPAAMRELARRPRSSSRIRRVDIVGTGGDGSGSFNISTGTALLTAACRRAGRQARQPLGLEPLGQRRRARGSSACRCRSTSSARATASRHGFHVPVRAALPPGDEGVAPVRQALGVRTVFNILGPLTNPAEPPFHVIGAYSARCRRADGRALAGMPI